MAEALITVGMIAFFALLAWVTDLMEKKAKK